jgi:hypothetical protein
MGVVLTSGVAATVMRFVVASLLIVYNVVTSVAVACGSDGMFTR